MRLRQVSGRMIPAFLVLGAAFAFLLTMVLIGSASLRSMEGVLMLLCGGFPVAGCALLPALSRPPGVGDGPNWRQWIFLVLASAMWSTAPIIGFAVTSDWNSVIGAGYRAMPMWMLAVLTWGVALMMLVAGCRQVAQARRAGSP